ncbi:hypothetical protein DFJ58DRAFT_729577 [Suillus subalutaceus]|uniref:uncharacterized protein n=1 Tax=Suillus subalutaceus TaxID=48586 RepID=UPI001B863FEE|nr:uncharacterized protein DFJ58DRAFT_729577 [Suillus subalutaceus]KAG1849285.1 hypothetical protein DFJ58DRAFT_729577 [Suillus subalutaceus]
MKKPEFSSKVLDDDTLIKKGNGKENNVGSDDKDDGIDDDSADRPKKKKKGKKTPDELPLNIEVAAHVKTLRNQWVYNKEHFPLSHNHFQIWAAAMMKNPPLMTVNQPPNHCALDADRDKNTSSTSTINFNIPPELLGFLCPPASKNAANTIALPHGDQELMPLLPPMMQPGLDLMLIDFYTKFSLANAILTKLHNNGYIGTCTIKYIVVSELKEMGFMNSEIAAMKDAVEQ